MRNTKIEKLYGDTYMKKAVRHKSVILTVAISLAIVTAAFLVMLTGREAIIEAENYSAEKRVEKLADELLDAYKYQTEAAPSVWSFFNESNKCSILYLTGSRGGEQELLELYVNFKRMDIYDPISTLTPEFDKVFEMDTEETIMDFCLENHVDYREDAICAIDEDELQEIIDALRTEKGVSL